MPLAQQHAVGLKIMERSLNTENAVALVDQVPVLWGGALVVGFSSVMEELLECQ